MTTDSKLVEVSSDGVTVWINIDGVCRARLGRAGSEIEFAPERGVHGKATIKRCEFNRFVERVARLMKIQVDEKHRPEWANREKTLAVGESVNGFRVIARGLSNILDSRLIEHVESIYCEFPPGLPAGASNPRRRDVLVLRSSEQEYGVYDPLCSSEIAWWLDADSPEAVLQAYVREIEEWRV